MEPNELESSGASSMSESIPPPIPSSQPPPLPNSQPPPLPQKPELELTRTGGVLVLLTAAATLGFGFFLPFWLLPRVLPSGTRYPALMIAIPTVVFGVLFFGGACWLTAKLGFPATHPKEQTSGDGIRAS